MTAQGPIVKRGTRMRFSGHLVVVEAIEREGVLCKILSAGEFRMTFKQAEFLAGQKGYTFGDGLL